MQKRSIIRAVIGAAVIALGLAACGEPPTPTVDPLVFTQTAAAEQATAAAAEVIRLTAEAKLNQQPTPTETPSPQPTRTPRPTETPTQRVVLTSTRTATPPPPPTATYTFSPYQCRLIEQTPKDGTTVDIEATVNVRWTVRNIGSTTWDSKAIDFLQMGGDKVAEESRIDLPKDVPPGEDVELRVVLKTTDRTGLYRTDWRLVFVEGGFTFCPLYVDIWAKDQ